MRFEKNKRAVDNELVKKYELFQLMINDPSMPDASIAYVQACEGRMATLALNIPTAKRKIVILFSDESTSRCDRAS